MNKKIFLAGALALSLMTGAAHAEQSAAKNYREMFRAEQFYLEYRNVRGSTDRTVKRLAAYNDKRMERSNETTPMWVKACNPLGALFGDRGKQYPLVLHKDGKYYQFSENDKMIELDEDRLGDENLNPREGWNGVRRKLALPIELSVFCPDDPYSSVSSAIGNPTFVNSYVKTVGKKQYDCDRYEATVKSLSGDESAQLIYEMTYDAGRLIEARLSMERDGLEYPINAIEIKKLTSEVPKGAFKIGRHASRTPAGTGDLDDLLENRKVIGTMEEL